MSQSQARLFTDGNCKLPIKQIGIYLFKQIYLNLALLNRSLKKTFLKSRGHSQWYCEGEGTTLGGGACSVLRPALCCLGPAALMSHQDYTQCCRGVVHEGPSLSHPRYLLNPYKPYLCPRKYFTHHIGLQHCIYFRNTPSHVFESQFKHQRITISWIPSTLFVPYISFLAPQICIKG